MLSSSEKQPDKILLSAILILIIFGLIMIASAGIIYSNTRFGDSYYFLKHQFFYGIIPGLVALYFFQKINYRFWKKISFYWFVVSLVFLVLVFVPGFGSAIYGASRWLKLGFFSFQPSEMAKLSVILYLAAWLENQEEKKIKNFLEGTFPFLFILGTILILILKQPDTGTAGLIFLVSFAIYFVSGASLSHLFGIFLSALAGLWLLVKIAPYRMNRFLVFLNPELDPRGIGYQINQALLAIGSGGIWGLGLGHSRQKYNYLPEPVGDSIFAIIGEELGLLGAALLVLLFLTVCLRGLKIAKNAPDEFGKLLGVGISVWIFFQAFINIASIISLIPLTGIPLPFISYGGTSMVFLLAAAGILLNISKHSKI